MTLAELPNLGPASARMLVEAGIETPEALRGLGAAFTYRVLRHRHGRRVNAVFLYALAGALADRHWASFSPDERAALRASAED